MRPLLLVLLWALASSTAVAAPKGLFVQVSGIPTGSEAWKAREWFQTVCDNHRTPGASDYIYDLVLSDTGNADGQLYTAQLDLVDDYFHCFNNIFMGTVDLAWAGEGLNHSRYLQGIMDSGYRWENIIVSRTIADALIARYPNLAFHWYVTLESNLNYFVGTNIGGSGYSGYQVKEAYKAYLLQLSNDLWAKRHGAILWSPTFWTPYGTLDAPTRANLGTAIADLLLATPRVSWLHFQDYLGQSSTVRCTAAGVCSPWQVPNYARTCSDAVSYYQLLRDVVPASVSSLAVNQEMFMLGLDNAGSLMGMFPSDPAELTKRELCYQQNGVPVGVSWEIRWWYLSKYGNTTVNVAYPP